MRLRYVLSRLGDPRARRVFGRWWAGICVAGALVTLLIFGGSHAFFIAAIWLLCVFAPLRIAIEILHTAGPRLRRDLVRSIEGRDDRYGTHEGVSLMVEALFAREVRLPRLAPPDLGPKVIEAATRVTERTLRSEGPLGIVGAGSTCSTLLQRWIGAVAAGEVVTVGARGAAGRRPDEANGATPATLWDPQASVQEQWVALRAIAGLAALTKTLTAVYEDVAGRLWESSGPVRALAEAAMDYADQVGLRLNGPPWEDIAGLPGRGLAPDYLNQLASTWLTFCITPPPAPRRLKAFVDALAT
jgi:hypothetical protein